MQKLEYDWISCTEYLFKNMLCNSLLYINKSLNELNFKSKWICGNSPKEIPIFCHIVAFNFAEVWSNTNVLMGPYLSYLKPLKGTKTFHQIVNNKIHGHLLYPGCPSHSSFTNKNEDKSKFIKPECCKLFWVRYEFQCEKGGTTIEVLPAMCKKMMLKSICLYFLTVFQMIRIYYAKCRW